MCLDKRVRTSTTPEKTKESNKQDDQHQCDIRDLGKRTQGLECDYDETNDKLVQVLALLDLFPV